MDIREDILTEDLEYAVLHEDGLYCERVPIDGIGDELETRGLVTPIQPKFHSIGVYRVTEAGRQFVREHGLAYRW